MIKFNSNIKELELILKRWNINLVQGFGPKVISSTLHEVIHHTIKFLKFYGNLQSFDESVCESTHHKQCLYYEHSFKKDNIEYFILTGYFLYSRLMESLPITNSSTRSKKAKNKKICKDPQYN